MTDAPIDEDIRYEAAAVALVSVALKQAEREGLDPCALLQTALREFGMTIVHNGHPNCALKALKEVAGEIIGREIIGFAARADDPTPPDRPGAVPAPAPADEATEDEIDEITAILNRHTQGVIH